MLVVFEGCDGVGKTTYIKYVKSILDKEPIIRESGLKITVASLPSDTPIGKGVRSILFDPSFGTKKMCKGVNTALFMADFIQAQSDIILPEVERGNIVLCDRWYYSEYAYGFTKKDTFGIYDNIWKAYQTSEFIKPKLVILITADPLEIAARLENRNKVDTKQRGKVWGASQYQEEVQKRYKEFFDMKRPSRLVTYDTTGDHTIKLAEDMATEIIRVWVGG